MEFGLRARVSFGRLEKAQHLKNIPMFSHSPFQGSRTTTASYFSRTNSPFSSISFNTRSATLNASIPAGIPQYALPSSAPSPSHQSKRNNSRSLQQTLPNLNLTRSIPHRTSNMRPQFRPLSQSRQHDQIKKTPRFELQTGTCPDGTPGCFLLLLSEKSSNIGRGGYCGVLL